MTCSTHYPHDGDGEALSYDRLEQPWLVWAQIARNFAYQVDAQDREDLMHNIIVRLACIKVAEYTRLRFYHQKKRWKRVFSVSLNSAVRDQDGNETEMIDILADDREIDLDSWLDAKAHYVGSSERTRELVQKRVSGAELSGWEWKLLKRFRSEYAGR